MADKCGTKPVRNCPEETIRLKPNLRSPTQIGSDIGSSTSFVNHNSLVHPTGTIHAGGLPHILEKANRNRRGGFDTR